MTNLSRSKVENKFLVLWDVMLRGTLTFDLSSDGCGRMDLIVVTAAACVHLFKTTNTVPPLLPLLQSRTYSLKTFMGGKPFDSSHPAQGFENPSYLSDDFMIWAAGRRKQLIWVMDTFELEVFRNIWHIENRYLELWQ